LRLLRAIAELYSGQNLFDQALACYERLATGETGDPTLERTITQTRERKYDQDISRLDPSVPEQAAQAAALLKAKQEFRLADARRRLERYPNDLQLRFELGMLYAEAGCVSEAIQEFQKSQNHPHIRIQSLYQLGQCFARRRMFDLAARMFENAIKEKPVFDEEKKTLIYALGTALEAMGRKEAAIEQFKVIYEADIAFKDVAGKVDAYYATQAG
jgi:tetratricopeptide (TPR) repeat protein